MTADPAKKVCRWCGAPLTRSDATYCSRPCYVESRPTQPYATQAPDLCREHRDLLQSLRDRQGEECPAS